MKFPRSVIKPQVLVLIAALGLISGSAASEEMATEGDSFRIEVGPAAERDLKRKTTSHGAALAVEKTVIEDWLELEVGLTRLNTAGRRAMGIDVIFKKPFRLSQTAELMVGVGPQVVRNFDGEERGTSFGMECVLDFMFWAGESRNIGWYFEPSYGLGIGNKKGERSLGLSSGLLIRWP